MPTPPKLLLWDLGNVLVAGRRHSGEAWGKDERAAVVRFAARKAREFNCDVGAAVAGALRDPFKRVSVRQHADSTATNDDRGNYG